MLDINGASALVTGGASGLGEATAKALAEKGAKVVICDLDRQAEAGEALAKEIGGVFAPTDVTDTCLLYTSPSPRDRTRSRMPSSA